MWIPSVGIVSAKNALEEDINDLINWIKKTDTKNRQESWAQEKNTMRNREETIW
jgi:hypothetical protein